MPAAITLTVAHLPSSVSFFLACLQPLNYVYRGRYENTIGFGLPNCAPDFWITQSIPGVPPGPAHVAFPAASREVVHRFFLAAIKAGAKCQGEPALRDAQAGYYSAAVVDFDDNSIEAVYREDLLKFRDGVAMDGKSVASLAQKSNAGSRVQTVVSSASKAKTATPSEIRSNAWSARPTSMVSSAPTNVSRAITTASSQPRALPHAASHHRSGDIFDEAKGTLNVAKELVTSVMGHKSNSTSNSNGHDGSNAIVGTLLGVAAGAALHYAYSNRKKSIGSDADRDAPQQGIARSETDPTHTHDRYRYYHGHEHSRPRQAIDNGHSTTYSRSSGQRMIEMIDNESPRSESAPSTIRPQRRRNSFAGTTTAYSSSRRRSIDTTAPPPTSFRAIEQAPPRTSRSRVSGVSRRSSITAKPSSPKYDEGYVSASDTRSPSSRRSSIQHTRSHSPTEPRRSESRSSKTRAGSVLTAIRNHIEPARTSPPSSRTHRDSAGDNDRQSYFSARTSASKHRTSHSHSHSHSPTNSPRRDSTVIGKLTREQLEKLNDNGRLRSDISRSMIHKVKGVENLDLSKREVRPEDSISQVS